MLWLLLACAPDVTGLSVEVDDAVPTVVHVTWSSRRPSRGRVEYGPTASYGAFTPEGDEGTEHRATILGLRADTTYHYRVVDRTDAGATLGDDHRVTTGGLPAVVPGFAITVPSADERFLLTSLVPGTGVTSVVFIVDAEGWPVWYSLPGEGVAPSARVTAAGDAVYYVYGVRDDTSTGALVVAPLDGSPPTEIAVPGAHHDAVELPDGRFVTIAVEIREVDGERIAGDRLVVVDLDGGVTELWNAFDVLPVEENANWAARIDGAIDWTHGNGLAFRESEDALYLSLYSTSSIVKIDSATGDTLWELGGAHSDFALDEPFGPQHAPEPFAGGVRFFDNGAASTGSRAVEYTLAGDAESGAGTATKTWEWRPDDRDRSVVLGDVARAPDGSALVGWGVPGAVYAVAPDGAVTWQAELEDQGAMGQVTRIPSLYP